MYTEEELSRLKNEEEELTEEELVALLAVLHITLSELEKAIRLFYQKYGQDGVITYNEVKKWVSSTNHTKRLAVLNHTISEIFDAGFRDFEKLFTSHLHDIVAKEAQFFGVDVDVAEILDTVWGVDDSTWLQRLTAHKQRWTIQIANDLKVSFLRQDEIIDLLEDAATRGKSMETILKRLWRTESNAVSSITRGRIYETLGVKKYRFLHLDGCHCEVCTNMHGQVFPISEYIVGVTANPLHPNCGDVTEPIIEKLG